MNEQFQLDAINAFGDGFVNIVSNAMMDGKWLFRDFAEDVNRTLYRLVAEWAKNKFFQWIASSITGGSGAVYDILTGNNFGGPVQGYQMGGYINPQSYQGGGNVDTVPAMLAEGEYVLNKQAVDTIGVESLNRMNRTGSVGANINISFSGNVLSKDFIENDAIPKIKDAIRRGADIGIG